VVAHRYDADLERRDGGRQHDALVVIALLNGSADDARHADTVAAHFHDLALAVLIQEGAVERLGVFAAQLEDVADFDAAADVENPLAVRRGISGNDVADVDDRRLWQVAAEIDAAQVVAGFIGATDEIGQVGDAAIGKNEHLVPVDADRPDEARLAAEALDDLFVGGKAERAECVDLACLDFVQFMIAAQQKQGEGLAAVLLLADHGDRLDNAVERHGEELGDIGTGHLARGVDLFHGQRGSGARCARRQCFGKFDVGGIVRGRAEGDVVFARVGQHVELMRAGTADRAGVGRHGTEFQAEAGEDAAVGRVHVAVFALQILEGAVEGVTVLHQELATAHDAEARADFVAELALDLVEVDWQLAVALDVASYDIGDDFLVRRADHEVPLVAVLEAQQLRSIAGAAPGFFPQLERLDRGHQQLQGASGIHFLAHDVLDLAQHAQTQRHPSVDAGGCPFDVAGPQHQFLADDFGIGRGFLESGEKELRGAHGMLLNSLLNLHFTRPRFFACGPPL